MKRRGASTGTAIGILIVGLLIGAGIVYAAAPSLGLSSTQTVTGGAVTTTKTLNSGLCNGQTITLGALNDLSGALSAQGAGDLAAENLAIQDVNSYLVTSGCSLTFALNNVDYHLDNTVAQNAMTSFNTAGVKVVIGPLNSGTAQSILSYANSNHMVMISPSSTSPALAIGGDYLFRTAPNDAAQGQADARIMVDQGVKAAIIINRDDTYGNGLANATKTWLMHDDATIHVYGPYAYDTTTTDFSTLLAQINSDWNTASGLVGADNVAIYAVSFEELGSILAQAQTQYPALLTTHQPWFGTDGEAQNSKLTNATNGANVASVRLPSTLFNVVNNSKTLDFYTRIHGTTAGAAILGGGAFYTFEGYDDVWLAALSILSAGSYNGQAVHDILPTVAGSFYGLTGWEGLQSSGDRIPGSYQVWKVVNNAGTIEWTLAGTWSYDTDTVSWISAP